MTTSLMTDHEIATALLRIGGNVALPAVIEYELEELGYITTDDGPYATVTPEGVALVEAQLASEEAA